MLDGSFPFFFSLENSDKNETLVSIGTLHKYDYINGAQNIYALLLSAIDRNGVDWERVFCENKHARID